MYNLADDKIPAVEDFLQKTSLKWEEILYIGDDIIDIPVLKKIRIFLLVILLRF